MIKFKKIIKQIKEELHDAEGYAECALKHKDDAPELAALYHRLSSDEMEHMTRLHEQVVQEISDYRKTHGEPPAAMLAVWEYEHDQIMEEAAEARVKISMYKG